MESLKRAKRKFWIAMVVTIALAVGMVLTWLYGIDLPTPRHANVAIAFGEVRAMRITDAIPDANLPAREFQLLRHSPAWDQYAFYPAMWTSASLPTKYLDWFVILPLWPLLLPSAIIAFRAHRAVRRLSRGGCTHCGYSRAGLAADAACPECGHPPASAVAASESAPR